ncbi:MAG: hypothetical protein R3244_07310, partial [Thermoanaerobaculia bacterium]|nr:hypothetical protein [Thermoanaerobaculia bacterium]
PPPPRPPRGPAATPPPARARPGVPARRAHDPTVAPRGLSPVLAVRYLRHRYLDPVTGVRIALDQAIEVSRVHPRFLADIGPRRLPQTVLEIKSTEVEPPAALAVLGGLGARSSSYSKYHAAFRAASASSLAGAHTPLHGQVA